METCKIIIADDHSLVIDAVKLLIETNDNIDVIGEACDGIELQQILKKHSPDVIIVDLKMPRMRGIEAIEVINELYPEIRLIVWSGFLDENKIKHAIAAGACGIVSKTAPRQALIAAIETVWKGGFYISPDVMESDVKQFFTDIETAPSLRNTEKVIITLIAEGYTSKEIGDLLHISKLSVDKHRGHIMKKLQLRNVVDLVRYAIKNGYCAL